ncbi:MAG: InlB B-repeat-containing protein, partial [Lachnospiraceae bacterium]|nr:InlB B-repeat-containing protein [Lachnospiraceae bacterium]
LPAGPTPPTGYSFSGWYTAKSGGTKISTSSTVDPSYKTLYAHYSAKTYTVTFDSTGGSSVSSIKVTFGNAYGTLPVPTMTNAIFLGWFTAKSGGTQITDATKVSTAANHTLYAQWYKNVVVVSFNVNGGYGNIPVATYDIGSKYGSLPAGPTPPTGHSFKGWFTAKSGGTQIKTTSTVSASYKTLYAQYSAKAYTISYKSDGGMTFSDSIVVYGTPYNIPHTPVRKYYTFLGWYTAETGGTKVEPTDIMKTAANHTLYAHWKRNTVNVSFNVNGGYGTIPSKTYNVGDTYGSLPAGPTPQTGYAFAGWFTAKTGGTEITTSSTVFSTRTVLYAQYTAKTYTVSFNANGGSAVSTKRKITYGTAYGTLPTTTLTYHTFLGWYTAKDGGTRITDTTKLSLAADHTLYAHWKRNTVNVSFNVNGGYGNIPNRTYNVGDTYGSFPAAPTSPQGHSFVGWFTAKSGGTRIYSTTQVYSSRTVLYAHYSANSYKVSFDANGGTKVSSTRTITYGTAYGTLPTTSRTYHTFLGWYTAKEGGNKITDTTNLSLAVDHTLYAHWKRNTVNVSFNVNGGYGNIPNRTYNVGDTYGSFPAAPTPPQGHSFVGWFTAKSGGTRIYSTTLVYSSRTVLYAQYTANSYTISFDANGGDAISTTKKITFGTAYGSLPVPYRIYHTFQGWYTAKESGTRITETTTLSLAANHTLYAHWKRNTVTVSFNSNGGYGNVPVQTYNVGDPYGKLPVGPTPPSGLSFLGWYTKAIDGDLVTEKTIVLSSRKCLYAHFGEAKWKVTFDSDGGSAVMQKTVIFGKAYGTLGTPTKSGYKFLGWYTAKSGGSPVTGTTIVSINKDHILYARWGKYVTVTFKAPEGMVYQSTKKVACNEQYGQLLAAVRPGYVFAGWYTAPDGRGTIVNANTLVTTTTDHNLYAKWIAQDSFTINDLLDLSGDDPNEYVPPQNMSHNIYNNPDLTSTSKEFTGFLIDFYTNSSAKGTYWALCNWTMDTSCLTRKGMTNIHYHFASSAYAGLQFTNDDAKCNIAFWRIDYTDPAGNDCYQNVNPTVVKGFSGKTMGTYDNEGSGYNYLKKFNWKAGKWYRMYLGCFTGDNGNTYVEYWIKDISANKWTHIVTIDTNLQDSFFTGSMYQFMENFSSDTCNSVRTLAYKNIFVRERSTGSWKSIISSTLSTKETNKKKGKVAFGSNSTTLYGITSGYGCPNNSAGKGMSLKVPMLSNTVSPDTPY